MAYEYIRSHREFFLAISDKEIEKIRLHDNFAEEADLVAIANLENIRILVHTPAEDYEIEPIGSVAAREVHLSLFASHYNALVPLEAPRADGPYVAAVPIDAPATLEPDAAPELGFRAD